jgi:hypothetical protein
MISMKASLAAIEASLSSCCALLPLMLQCIAVCVWQGLSTHHRYLLAIYWALTTMSTIGFGDIHAVNRTEHWVAIVVMLIGASVFGVVIGGMTDLVDNLDPERQRKSQRMAQVNAHSKLNCIELMNNDTGSEGWRM